MDKNFKKMDKNFENKKGVRKLIKEFLLPFFLIAFLCSLLCRAKFNLRLSFFDNLATSKKSQFLFMQVGFQFKIKIF